MNAELSERDKDKQERSERVKESMYVRRESKIDRKMMADSDVGTMRGKTGVG
jgi:hypothetical protein